jgi:hypothetical protein
MLLVLATSGICGELVVVVVVVIGRSFSSSSTSDSMDLFAKYVTDISICPVQYFKQYSMYIVKKLH